MSKEKLLSAMREVSELNDDGIKVQGGKKYTQVVTRVEVFRKNFGFEYGIETVVSEFGGGFAAKATVREIGTDKVIGTGHSYTKQLAKEKSLEKLETTAIGRALASCGLSGGEYATQDEIDTHDERYKKQGGDIVYFHNGEDRRAWMVSAKTQIEAIQDNAALMQWERKNQALYEQLGEAQKSAMDDIIAKQRSTFKSAPIQEAAE